MPNHVTNVIKMEGISSEPLYVYNDGISKCFDFNKLIPMPESLDIVSDSMLNNLAVFMVINKLNNGNTIDIPGINVYINKNYTKEKFEKDREFFKNWTDDQLIELGLQLIQNKALYGFYDWYGWCNWNWTTKWNAYNNHEISPDEIEFTTAWNEPSPILIELSKRYPMLSIQHWWAEEFFGSGNSGCRLYKNGVVYGGYDEPMSYDSIVHCLFCWGHLSGNRPYEGNAVYNLGDGNAIYKLNENGNTIFYLSGNKNIESAVYGIISDYNMGINNILYTSKNEIIPVE